MATTDEAQLLALDAKKFIEFDLSGNKMVCRVLRVHDCDTMTIGFVFAGKFYKKNVRWAGIDSPELHSKVPDEAKLCRLGREYIIRKYLNKLIIAEMGSMDKYGRILATIYDRDDGQNVNQWLIANKFVRAYGGDLHKDIWSIDELQAGIISAGSLGITDPGK